MAMELANGPAPNAVVLELNGARQSVSLLPSESRTREVPVSEGRAYVRIGSPAGFRPSDVGPSRDTRYLGVRVRMR